MAHHSELKGGLFGDESIVVERCTLADAQRLVRLWHRHHGPVVGHKFSLRVYRMNILRKVEAGVAIIGRPVSRHLDDGNTLEITRLATDGSPNAASKLLAYAAKVAHRLGYERVITYTLAAESGSSLKGAGFTIDKHCDGGSWNSPSRPRLDKHPTGPKIRWSRSMRPYSTI